MKKRSMILITITVVFTALMLFLFLESRQTQTTKPKELQLTPGDRILILAPHPDDEVLGCAGIIQKALAMNVPVRIVFFTYGDNNQWSFILYRKHPVVMPRAVQAMGLVRHDEAIHADKVLGVPQEQLTFLGYPDFRTLDIWCSHWADRPAASSMLTEVRAVPYSDAFRPGAPYKGEEILADLKTIFRDFNPTKIFLSHPADHNPDHKSLYLFSRVALWDLEDELQPELYPYIVHYADWPKPRGYRPEVPLTPPAPLSQNIPWCLTPLAKAEIETKHDAIRQHRSQYDASKRYLLSFIRSNELFGDFEPVVVSPRLRPISLTSKSERDAASLPEELIDEERASFVGIENRLVALEEDSLVITTTLSRPLGETVGLSLYVFGYRKDEDFKDMPKLHIRFGAIGHGVFNQDTPLPEDTIKVLRRPREVTLRIPLEALGNPQRILTSAATYLGLVPLDSASWRAIEIKEDAVRD
jgi:LmbE family N-acetylglucosaminyl deacetylase